ncbi:MAG: hypothetical protein VKP70_04475 [Cyanobacteriota bacterium]|nr:hypothetical protein [Cyanobacteriota bacterium]
MGPCWRERLGVFWQGWVQASLCAAYRNEKQPLWLTTIQNDQGPVREYFFILLDVACRKCGCRMVTKVGRTHPMLICSDCGLPVDERETSQRARKRVWGALTLVSMAFVSGSMLLLATLYEWRTAGTSEDALEQQGDGAGSEEKRQEKRALFEPSGLIQSLEQPADPQGMAPVSGRREGARSLSVSAQPTAAEAQEDKQQDANPQHQR